MNTKVTFMKVMNTIAFLTMITVNGLANLLPLNGITTGEVSDSYSNFFVPAGFTFGIWGVIYILLAAFVMYQFVGGTSATAQVEKIAFLFVLSSAMNCLWIFMWHYRLIAVSVLVMIVLLVSLILIYIRLGTGKDPAQFRDYAFVRVPFSVYLGWISVATIANVTAFLVDLGWRGEPLPGNIWAVLMILTAAALALIFIFTRKDIPYSLVTAWAFTGIFIKRSSINTGADIPVMWAAGAGIALIAVSIFIMEINRSHTGKRPSA